MTTNEPDWADLPGLVAVGDFLRARVLQVERFGMLLDLGLPFPGFMDRLAMGEDLGRFHPGSELDVVVVQLADWNQQVRVHLAESCGRRARVASDASVALADAVVGPAPVVPVNRRARLTAVLLAVHWRCPDGDR